MNNGDTEGTENMCLPCVGTCDFKRLFFCEQFMKHKSYVVIAMAVSSLCSSRTWAENVDLSTVPKRDSVQLTIYNSEDITLVRETRVVTFKKGINPLQFSWANTLIDPSSLELRFISSADKLDVADTTFPHDKPQMLYWNVRSEFDGEATIQITYFTSGITWSADDIAIADKEESKLDIDGFVRITNNSGEEYENAHVRLVVGTINLVEKVAELAKLSMSQVKNLPTDAFRKARREVAWGVMTASGGALAPSSSPK